MTSIPSATLDQLLKGIRVVDVTRALAGPYCTMLLGDQGGEVIEIEQPGWGANGPLRPAMPPPSMAATWPMG